MAGIAGQDKMGGVFDHLAEGRRWNLTIFRTRHEFTAETVRSAISRGADGFIVGIPDADDALAELSKTDKPVVLMNIDPGPLEGRARTLTVKSDAEAVGREAAQMLLAQGAYHSYGFAGFHTNADWSRERGRGFRDALEQAGFIGRMFDVTHYQDKTQDRATLQQWLRDLPKPCGILAACDDRAYELIDACREIGLRIPSEIGIVGVNNDPLLCENSEPTISSIQPDFRREGYLAAQHLERMMNCSQAAPTSQALLVGIRQIVHRESTYPLSPSGKLVQRALAYISRNAACKLSVADVAAHLKVSRSLLDLRFRELQRETVHDAIFRARLEEVKRRLRASGDPIKRISEDCGWTNTNALRNAFLRATGTSMRDYRELPTEGTALVMTRRGSEMRQRRSIH